MSPGNIIDMDIVPNASPVRSWVISAVNGKLCRFAFGALERPGDQMGRFCVSLSQAAFCIGSGYIKVSQGNVVKITRGRYVPKYILHHGFCRAIRVDRFHLRRLINRNPVWNSVYCGAGGIEKFPDIGTFHGLQKVYCIAYIVFIILQRFPDRLFHLNGRRKMDDRVGSEYLYSLIQKRDIGNIPSNKLPVQDGPWMSCGQIIENKKIMTFTSQSLDYMATNVAGASGYKYFHMRSLQ